MTDREKLIELLSDAPFGVNKQTLKSYLIPEAMADVADHLIANGVTFATDNNVGSKWISVKDRLPENICPVLVVLEGISAAFNGWYHDGKWWTVGAGTRPFTQKVTHWMPLPESPKGE